MTNDILTKCETLIPTGGWNAGPTTRARMVQECVSAREKLAATVVKPSTPSADFGDTYRSSTVTGTAANLGILLMIFVLTFIVVIVRRLRGFQHRSVHPMLLKFIHVGALITQIMVGLWLAFAVVLSCFELEFAGPLMSLLAGAAAATVVNYFIFDQFKFREGRANSDLHGKSNWMENPELIFADGGIILGETSRGLLRFNGDTGSGHILVIAGSGGYKTTGTVIPCALEWPESLVCLDPSGTVSGLTRETRRGFQHRVVVLDPEDPASDSFNALDWIDPTSDRAISDLQSVATWLTGEKSGHTLDYWEASGKDLLAALLADVLFDQSVPAEKRTLALVRERLTEPRKQLQDRLERIGLKSAGYGFASQLAAPLSTLNSRQFDGIHHQALLATSWLSIPSLARLVCGSGFNTRHMLTGRLDVFINLREKVLSSTPGIARLVVGSLLNRVYEARGANNRVLFLLDEAFALGPMKLLENARDQGRKYRINLALLYQSLGQITETWGQYGRQSWFDSTYAQSFAYVGDTDAAEFCSKMAGTFTAYAPSEHDGTSSHGLFSSSSNEGSGTTLVPRRLISADEVKAMRPDEQVLLIHNAAPIFCRKAVYFKRPELLEKTGPAYSVAAG